MSGAWQEIIASRWQTVVAQGQFEIDTAVGLRPSREAVGEELVWQNKESQRQTKESATCGLGANVLSIFFDRYGQ